MLSYSFIKAMFSFGFSIDDYVKLGQITPEQYREITSKQYEAN